MRKGAFRAVLLLGLAACGCGYRLVGAGGAAAERIWIGFVEDETHQPLFGSYLRAALAREVVDRAGLALSSRSDATGLLTVRAASVTEKAVAFVEGDRPRVYLLTAEIEAALTRAGGDMVWKGLRLRAEREFAAGSTVEETQANKGRGLELLAGDLAREILRRVALAQPGAAG